jgi:hypothetical protein
MDPPIKKVTFVCGHYEFLTDSTIGVLELHELLFIIFDANILQLK